MTLVYQAYGRQDVLEQTVISIASLLWQTKEHPPMSVLIYTDQPMYFDGFFKRYDKVQTIAINNSDLQNWRGEINFVHRVKIEILKNAGLRNYGPLFYCDGDTLFTKNPESLFEQVNDSTSLMHLPEAELGKPRDPLTKKIGKFVRKHQFAVSINDKTVMWNAGVIGISQKNKNLLPVMIELTDSMYKLYPKHVMEQLAVSAVLQSRTKILPSDDCIYHYWDNKEGFQEKIQNYLAQSSPSRIVDDYSKFSWPQQKPALTSASLFNRISNIFR